MRASGEWRGEAPGMQRPSQPEQPNDGCLTLIDRFLDFTLVGVPRWNAEWLSRRSPAYQRRVNAYWERQRRNLYLPLILRSCTGVFAVLVAFLAALLAVTRAAAGAEAVGCRRPRLGSLRPPFPVPRPLP
jgi:hypothetical protein